MRREQYRGQTQNRGMGSQGGGYGNNPPNFGSARSDYGDLAYGGNLSREGLEDRGWWDRTSDELSSWLGDEEAARRRQIDERREASRYQGYGGQRRSGDYPYGYYPVEPDSAFANMAATEYINWRDWHNLRAGDIMTTNIATVFPNDSVQFAARLMRDEDCGALPVVDRHGRMIGMITDRDITVRLVADGYNANHALVRDCMTQEIFCCHVGDSLETCMRAMSRHQIRRMPIVDDRNRVVGIISQGDLARHAEMNRGQGERRAFTDVVCAISEPSDEAYR